MSIIRDILDRKGGTVLSVQGGDSVYQAIGMMAEANIGAVLVKEKDTVAGIFSERDYLKKVALRSRSSRQTEVREVMSSPVITVSPGDSVDECMEIMTNCRCRHLPVVTNDQLVGIVSIGDLVRQTLADKEEEIQQLNQYIAGSY